MALCPPEDMPRIGTVRDFPADKFGVYLRGKLLAIYLTKADASARVTLILEGGPKRRNKLIRALEGDPNAALSILPR